MNISIIGNPNRERKSKILGKEFVDELNEYYSDPKNTKEGETPEKSDKSELTQILQRDETGKPKLDLTPLEKTAVNTRTQGDYWTLMRIYECGGWKRGEVLLPTQNDIWEKNREGTCIYGGIDYFSLQENIFGYCNKEFYQFEGWKIIPLQEFYDRQKITPEMINEINKWFDDENSK